MSEQIIHFEDYELGHERLTTGRTITETDFVVHAGAHRRFLSASHGRGVCQDPAGRPAHCPRHNDLSIGVGLTASLINPVAFSYGYDRLRFVRPVHIGDTIRTRVTISAKEDDPKRPKSGRVVERLEVINQRGEVVLAADHILVVERKA